MTKRDYKILKLFEEAIDNKDAEAMTKLWRRFAWWHGLNPDFAAVLQERQSQDAAGFDLRDRLRAIVAEREHKRSSSVH